MPRPWPSRLLSGSTPARPADDLSPSPSPRARAQAAISSPGIHSDTTLNHKSPSPPQLPDRSQQRSHTRSSSHPLPRLFSKKRSDGHMRPSEDDDDFTLDEASVPTLAELPAESPSKSGSGKRFAGDGNSVTRRCMCCHNKIRYPSDIKVFRCTSCLTINDLEPLARRDSSRLDNTSPSTQSTSTQPPHDLSALQAINPLSVQRVRVIIHQCLQSYLRNHSRGPTKADLDHTQMESSSVPEYRHPNEDTAGSIDASTLSSSAYQQRSTLKSHQNFHLPLRSDSAEAPSRPPLPKGPNAGSSVTRNSAASPGSKVPLSDRPTYARYITPPAPNLQPTHSTELDARAETDRYERAKKIFRPLEDYIVHAYGRHDSLNQSFLVGGRQLQSRNLSEGSITLSPKLSSSGQIPPLADGLPQIDHKMLLVGDIAENGNWWTGQLGRKCSAKLDESSSRRSKTSSTNAAVDWDEVWRWYDSVHNAGQIWWDSPAFQDLDAGSKANLRDPARFRDIDRDITIARSHVERLLLKVAENLLKRPGLPLDRFQDLRFLMIILANPSLNPSQARSKPRYAHNGHTYPHRARTNAPHSHGRDAVSSPHSPASAARADRECNQHTGILKRCFGLLAGSPLSCHGPMVVLFSQLPRHRFGRLVDIVASFVTYRLSRPPPQPKSKVTVHDGGLIPDLSSSAAQTSLQLQAAPGLSGATKASQERQQSVVDYSEDWQLKAAAKVMALLFAANSVWKGKDMIETPKWPGNKGNIDAREPRANGCGQLLPTSEFYNTLLDYHDLVADFRAWESRLAKFTFCQYPFFLSMGSKIKILEFDAKRQMETKARQAYFDSVISSRASDVALQLTVRRECMVDDSLRQISEAVGAGQEELKKSLKVRFSGEEGIDAGGLRKEWFLLLVREIFDPNFGMFLYDDESQNCYFNPNSFENSDQYHLVGALLGLAIYNSTILDVALPPFAFRKLIAAAPGPSPTGALPSAGVRNQMTYTTKDLAEYRPSLASGLEQLLIFEGDVQNTFCLDFVVPLERYGTVIDMPLCTNGENRPVTNENRAEYVNLYIKYLLDTAVTRQFEPFKRGFYTVCAGAALSLFRAEEIELLVRGSDEALDVDSLQAVAVYENWKTTTAPHQTIKNPIQDVPVVQWFWEYFRKAPPLEQRKLLLFVTGSDRIPAVGATSLVLKIVGGGDGTGRDEAQDRFPVARTCFNTLVLWRYESRSQMEERLGRAIMESEGFGLR